MADWVPPAAFDEYRLDRPLGRGGMGLVYLGYDDLLKRPVAVKFIAAVEPDDRRRQRFLLEGRAIARLAHPNVVAVHRVGEVEGRPYLVAEYVPGQSLDQLRKPLPQAQVIRIALGLAKGLAAAHRHGVLHRDIKPGNAVLAADGEVKLLDFGIAKVDSAAEHVETATATGNGGSARLPLTHTGTVLGTPAYMAPETLRGEPATRRSDLYSLGAVLHELCTGQPPASEAPPLAQGSPAIDRRLAAIVDRCLQGDPAERFASAEEVVEALEQLSPDARIWPAPRGNPYRGLRPFEAEHRAVFFGRDAEVRAVVELLRGEPLVVVAGDSGVGKSSLCAAGVLPLVEAGSLEQGRAYAVARLVPGRRPLAALSQALSPLLGNEADALEAWIRSDPGALARALRKRAQGGGATLLYIDQLEELFTLSGPADAALLGEALGRLSALTPGVRVLMTIRGDFFTRLASLPGLGDEVARALYLLRPLGPERLREIVVGPARRSGVSFESDELVDGLVQSAAGAAGGLPLLQFALSELWEERDRAQEVIPRSALARIGGVEGSLARHADAVLARLLPEERASARRLLLQLVTPEGTRARRTAEELGAGAGPARTALEALVQGRLLVAREAEGATAYELSHEALVDGWATLSDWLDADGDRRLIRERIKAAAGEWERLGRAREALWHQRQLAEAARVDDAELGEREGRFLAVSRAAVRRTRVLRRAAIVGAPVLLAGLVLAARLRTQHEARQRADAHVASAERSLAEADAADRRSRELRQQALALFDADRPDEPSWRQAEELWARALQEETGADERYAAAGQDLEAALRLDGARSEARRLLGDSMIRRIGIAEREFRPSRELAQRLDAFGLGPQATGLRAPATLEMDSAPRGASVQIERISGSPTGMDDRQLGTTPLSAALAPGTYRVTASVNGRPPGRVVVRLSRGERRPVVLPLPLRVPPGFVLVPAGRFIYGSTADEMERSWLDAPPAHEVDTGPFLIARDEVTFADWVDFLDSLEGSERALRTPGVASRHGALSLARKADGWQLTLQPSARAYVFGWGRTFDYKGREQRVEQDWRRFPVSAISLDDARAYLAWLDRTGKAPGARLCDDREWERAARGADERLFTTGDKLDPSSANIDLTYGRVPAAFGPDEVGSHTESDSPFRVHDMVGNISEMVALARAPSGAASRGGSWYQGRLTARLDNRTSIDASLRSVFVGLRVCAPAPKE